MKNKKTLLFASIVFLSGWLIGFAAFSSWAKSSSVLSVPINRSEVISTNEDMGEVIVADPEIADVYVHGKNKLSVIGKGLGITNIRIFNGKNDLIREMEVHVTYDLPAIRRTLKEF